MKEKNSTFMVRKVRLARRRAAAALKEIDAAQRSVKKFRERLELQDSEIRRLKKENAFLRARYGLPAKGSMESPLFVFRKMGFPLPALLAKPPEFILPIPEESDPTTARFLRRVKNYLTSRGWKTTGDLLKDLAQQESVWEYIINWDRIGLASAKVIIASLRHFNLCDEHNVITIKIPSSPSAS